MKTFPAAPPSGARELGEGKKDSGSTEISRGATEEDLDLLKQHREIESVSRTLEEAGPKKPGRCPENPTARTKKRSARKAYQKKKKVRNLMLGPTHRRRQQQQNGERVVLEIGLVVFHSGSIRKDSGSNRARGGGGTGIVGF